MSEKLILLLFSMLCLMIGTLGESQDFTILSFWCLGVVLIDALTDINKTLKSK